MNGDILVENQFGPNGTLLPLDRVGMRFRLLPEYDQPDVFVPVPHPAGGHEAAQLAAGPSLKPAADYSGTPGLTSLTRVMVGVTRCSQG